MGLVLTNLYRVSHLLVDWVQWSNSEMNHYLTMHKMGLSLTWTINQIEPLSGDPLRRFDCNIALWPDKLLLPQVKINEFLTVQVKVNRDRVYVILSPPTFTQPTSWARRRAPWTCPVLSGCSRRGPSSCWPRATWTRRWPSGSPSFDDKRRR